MASKTWLAGLLVALAASGPASAQMKLEWQQRPTGADVLRFYPKGAADRGVAGRAIVDCDVSLDGVLEHCRVADETPAGQGFGEAALQLAGLFRMDPLTVPPEPERRRLVTPMTFGLPDRPLPELGYQAGQNAWMMKVDVRKGSRGARPCPEEGKPAQLCTDHPIAWAKQPSLQATLPALDGVDMEAGTSVLLCESTSDGTLAECLTTPEATPAARKAMLALAPLFVAPQRAQDGVVVAGGQVAIPFDWSKITPLARKLKRP